MLSAALLATIAAGCLVAAARLRTAAWPVRGPHAAVVVWQALGLAWGIATIGALLAFALAPYERGVLGGLAAVINDAFAHGRYLAELSGGVLGIARMVALAGAAGLTSLLLYALVGSFVNVLRTRSRHRYLLQLVAREDPEVPGAHVLDHPAAAAYCLPGMLRSQVVVSAGALAVLDRRELAAVLAHEHAHLRQRHDLVLLPFSSLKRAFPRVGIVTSCYNAVALLIEICADERARRQRSSRELATALLRFDASGHGPVPAGALAATDETADPEVITRVSRLLNPAQRLSGVATAGLLAASATLMATTLALWHLPM